MGFNVLFVDDDIKMLDIYKKIFNDNYSINLAENAVEGLNFIKKNDPYAVVIADMKMPGMNGIEFLEEVKKVSPYSTRIMVTGNADLEIAIEAINKGNIFHFLTKPCRKKYLENIVSLGIKKYEEEINLRIGSLEDPLTGLWNRRYFNKKIKESINLIKKRALIFSIIFIDINDFKQINDTMGHHIGDKSLILVANAIKKTCRKSDVTIRYGGDEFLLFLEHEEKDGANGLVLRLKKIILNNSRLSTDLPDIMISAGVSTYPYDSNSLENLLKIADEEMYRDKESQKALHVSKKKLTG